MVSSFSQKTENEVTGPKRTYTKVNDQWLYIEFKTLLTSDKWRYVFPIRCLQPHMIADMYKYLRVTHTDKRKLAKIGVG
jgi:hypothetical protein